MWLEHREEVGSFQDEAGGGNGNHAGRQLPAIGKEPTEKVSMEIKKGEGIIAVLSTPSPETLSWFSLSVSYLDHVTASQFFFLSPVQQVHSCQGNLCNIQIYGYDFFP